jgi:hypothetical protein
MKAIEYIFFGLLSVLGFLAIALLVINHSNIFN